jgi:endonuclease YncB( thermonuclease family)
VSQALISAALLVAATASAGAFAKTRVATLTGVVTHVSDGDTLWVRSAADARQRKPVKVRLLGIDAPERCQSGGREATAALRTRVLHREVIVQVVGKDIYDRWLGNVRLEGQDVGAWMVLEGHAWSHRRDGRADTYVAEERKARVARRGLFGEPDAIEPRLFRQQHGPCD